MNSGHGSFIPRSKSKQTETPRTKLHQSRRPVRHTSANSNTGSNNCSSEAKRICGSGNSIRSSRRQPCRRVYLGPPRCSRTGPSLLPPMFKYKNYGRSTDLSYDEIINAGSQTPNPYTELAREVCLAFRRREDTSSQPQTPPANTKTTPPEGDSGHGPVSVDILIKGETTKENAVTGLSDDKIFRAQDEQDDEDDEDEGGMPQETPSGKDVSSKLPS